MRRPAITASLLLLLTPGMARAASWCVDATGIQTDFSMCGGGCANTSPLFTIAEALDAATVEGAQDGICVATPGVHTETVVVDNSAGALGAGLLIAFGGLTNNFCPDVAGSPAFTFIGRDEPGPPDQFDLQRIDWRDCPGAAGPLASVHHASLVLHDSRIIEVGGPVIEAQDVAGTEIVQLNNSRIEAADGVVYRGGASFVLYHSEVSGSVGAPGEPLIEILGHPLVEAHSRAVDLFASALFGNTSQQAPLIRSPQVRISSCVVSGNVVLGGEALIELAFEDADQPIATEVELSVLSRNRLLESAPAPAPTVVERPITQPGADDYCLPAGSDQHPFLVRPLPDVSASPADAALFVLDGTGAPADAFFHLMKCFVVDNELGSAGALVRATGNQPRLQVNLIHDTVTSPGLIIDGQQTGTGGRFTSARNLYLGQPTASLGAGFTAAEITMDLVEQDPASWFGAAEGLLGVAGPIPPAIDWSQPFRSDVGDLSELQRNELVCADGVDEPSMLGPTCGLDSAVGYFPTATTVATAAVPWPWRGEVLEILQDGDPQGMPGATGWACRAIGLPFDGVGIGGGLDEGDGDGFSSLVDCDNNDGDVTPQVPAEDGFDGVECVGNECYECPEFDDDSRDDDDGPAASTIGEGCDAKGCGYSYRHAGLLLVVPWTLVRRRRRRSRLPPPIALPPGP